MHVLLLPIGSHGDVHPFVALGVALRDRGHRVTFVSNPHFRGLVEHVGLDYLPIGTEELFHQAIDNEDLWDPMKGFKLLAKYTGSFVKPIFDLIKDHYEPGQMVVATQVTAYGARIAQEALGVPLVSIDLQPALLRSAISPPVLLPAHALLRRLPPAALRWLYGLADRKIADPLLAPAINEFRTELGLEPIERVMEWWHSPQKVLGLFPDWYAPPQPDWPPAVELTGFPLYDEQELHGLPPEVEQFLLTGSPPVVFTPGSAMKHAASFFEAAVHACHRLGRRGILLTRYTEQLPARLPETVAHFAYVPFSELLPRCAALVHHGGIGTTAQALAAGVPQVVMPLAHDQPDNAERVERLGVGRSLYPRKFRGPALARRLHALLDSPQVAAQCQAYAARLKPHDAILRACEAIERFHREQSPLSAG